VVGQHGRTGKAFDTRHFFVICSNVIGGCRERRAASISPQTGKPMP
jgi:homoserine acetyltransferase